MNLKYSLFLFLASTSVLRYFYFYIGTCVTHQTDGPHGMAKANRPRRSDPSPNPRYERRTQQAANPIELTWPCAAGLLRPPLRRARRPCPSGKEGKARARGGGDPSGIGCDRAAAACTAKEKEEWPSAPGHRRANSR